MEIVLFTKESLKHIILRINTAHAAHIRVEIETEQHHTLAARLLEFRFLRSIKFQQPPASLQNVWNFIITKIPNVERIRCTALVLRFTLSGNVNRNKSAVKI